MSVVVLFGAGALIGLVALTVVVIITLLTEEPDTAAEESSGEGPDPEKPVTRDRSVV
ncbi:hypothetical protein [Nocardiopsis sp. ATB16-24]|uniref:hypothetical protein n=1 Tax=Nocardiopsis sp. ATB16-24 TaxID=3019555 RepID=UPI00255519BF|nr:hypothetical protein [Nocardiopsis sp. ATB16-24]